MRKIRWVVLYQEKQCDIAMFFDTKEAAQEYANTLNVPYTLREWAI